MAALQFPEVGQASAYGVGQASACQWQAPEAGLPWQEALDFCDRFSLTLVFGAAAGDTPPGWVPIWGRTGFSLSMASPGGRSAMAGSARFLRPLLTDLGVRRSGG